MKKPKVIGWLFNPYHFVATQSTFKLWASKVSHFLRVQSGHVSSYQKKWAPLSIILLHCVSSCSITALSWLLLTFPALCLYLYFFGLLISTAWVCWCTHVSWIFSKWALYFCEMIPCFDFFRVFFAEHFNNLLSKILRQKANITLKAFKLRVAVQCSHCFQALKTTIVQALLKVNWPQIELVQDYAEYLRAIWTFGWGFVSS